MATPSDISAGVNPASLRAGSWIDVETKSRHYRIDCMGGNAIRISGHPDHCLTPVDARLHGSVHSEGVVEMGMIEPGGKVMVFLNGVRPLITSRVVRFEVHQPAGPPSRVSSSSIH